MDEPNRPKASTDSDDADLDEPADEPAEPPLEPGDNELADVWWAL